jgi:hypothetical protein
MTEKLIYTHTQTHGILLGEPDSPLLSLMDLSASSSIHACLCLASSCRLNSSSTSVFTCSGEGIGLNLSTARGVANVSSERESGGGGGGGIGRFAGLRDVSRFLSPPLSWFGGMDNLLVKCLLEEDASGGVEKLRYVVEMIGVFGLKFILFIFFKKK